MSCPSPARSFDRALERQGAVEVAVGVAEVAQPPVAFADVVHGGGFFASPAALAEFAGQALEQRQGLLRAVLAIHRDRGVEARIEPEGFGVQRRGEQQTDRQYATERGGGERTSTLIPRPGTRRVREPIDLSSATIRIDVNEILDTGPQRGRMLRAPFGPGDVLLGHDVAGVRHHADVVVVRAGNRRPANGQLVGGDGCTRLRDSAP